MILKVSNYIMVEMIPNGNERAIIALSAPAHRPLIFRPAPAQRPLIARSVPAHPELRMIGAAASQWILMRKGSLSVSLRYHRVHYLT